MTRKGVVRNAQKVVEASAGELIKFWSVIVIMIIFHVVICGDVNCRVHLKKSEHYQSES